MRCTGLMYSPLSNYVPKFALNSRTGPACFLCLVILLWMTLWESLAFADEDLPITEFEATYKANVKLVNGTVKISFRQQAEGKYRFVYHVQLGWFWESLIRGKLTETTTVEFDQGRPVPLEYRLTNTMGSNPRNGRYRFDWPEGRLVGTYKDKDIDIPIQPGVVDRSLLMLQLMWDLKNDNLRSEYLVFDRDEIEAVSVEKTGEEFVTLESEFKYDTVVITHTSADESDVTFLWLVPEFGFVPVKVEQYADGDEVFHAELSRYAIWP